MSARLVAVTYDAGDPARLASFWAGLLGREVLREESGAVLPGEETQVALRFVAAPDGMTGPDRLHLHLTSSSVSAQEKTVAHALALGAHHLDVGQLPEEGHVVLADPEGHAFCVIEPGNQFLAGCGHLGEVSWEGSRRVGLFWRDALG